MDVNGRQIASHTDVLFLEELVLKKAETTATAATSKISTADCCSICMEPLQSETSESDSENESHIVSLPCCHHAFHKDCILQWFNSSPSSSSTSRTGTCPLCNHQFLIMKKNNIPVNDEHNIATATTTNSSTSGTCRSCRRQFYRDSNNMNPCVADYYRCQDCRSNTISQTLFYDCIIS